LRLSSEKRLRLFTGRAYPELADEVASELGIPITPTSAYDFANGEIFVRFEESVRGRAIGARGDRAARRDRRKLPTPVSRGRAKASGSAEAAQAAPEAPRQRVRRRRGDAPDFPSRDRQL